MRAMSCMLNDGRVSLQSTCITIHSLYTLRCYCVTFCSAKLCSGGLCCRAVRCLSVCPSRSCIVSKWGNILSNLCYRRIVTPV